MVYKTHATLQRSNCKSLANLVLPRICIHTLGFSHCPIEKIVDGAFLCLQGISISLYSYKYLSYKQHMIGIILWIALFMFLVIIHELGHFIAAKKSGVKVLEFGIGIPPKAFKLWTDKSGTEYTVNRIPLWGFVRLKGEDPKDTEDFNAPDSFIKATVRKKIIILLWWVTVNFAFAWIVFTAIFTRGIKPISIIPENAIATESRSYLMPTASFLKEQWFLSGDFVEWPATIADIFDWWLAGALWLAANDTITQINNRDVNAINISLVLQRYIGEEITVQYQRGDETRTAQATCPDDNCMLGVILDDASTIEIQPIKFPFPQSIGAWWREMGAQAELTFNALGTLGKNLLSFDGDKINGSLDKLTGPVGAVKFGEMLRQSWGWIAFLAFGGIISLALALFNVLPIPALDGGRLLGVLIQRIGRLKAEKYFTIEWYLNLLFFVLLMWLGIYIIFKDLVRFWGVSLPWMG